MNPFQQFRKYEEKRRAGSIRFGSLGVVFSVVVGFIAAMLGGAGHGSALYMELIFAPMGFGGLVWPVVGAILPWYRKWYVACLIGLLLAANYLGFVLALAQEGISYFFKVFDVLLPIAAFVVLSYLSVQVFVLGLLIRVARDSAKLLFSNRAQP